MTIGESMRRDWDDRARKDAFFYIASWRKDWNETSFLESGEDDYKRFVAKTLERHAFSTEGKSMLELGCGAGRMTRSLAQRFTHVAAVDISSEMLAHARALHDSVANIEWVRGNGADLAEVRSASVDFVFSYLVLQHLPTETLFDTYIREILRVLIDGGLCLFQFNGTGQKNMNWKGRIAWEFVDALWAMRLAGASKAAAKLLGLDPEMAGKSWHGVHVKSEDVAKTVRENGGLVLELIDPGTPMAWCCAKKTMAGGRIHGT